MKSFEEQIKDLRDGSSSVSQVSTDSNRYFFGKYGPGGDGGNMKFDGNFIPGKIYSASYKTKTMVSEKHPFIDRSPIFMFVKKERHNGSDILISLDLNVIPPDYRGNILFKLWEQYFPLFKENSQLPYSSQAPVRNITQSFDRLLSGTGWKTSLTGFKRDFIAEVSVVDYEDWVRIPYISDFRIEGQSTSGIYNDYRSKLNA